MLMIDVLEDETSENWSVATMLEEQCWAVKALNKTAQQAAADVQKELPQRFTMRSPWAQKGIRFDQATIDNPVTRVYSVDNYMWKQEFGESYKPDGHVAIPSAARSSPKSLIPRSMLPNSLRSRDDVFKFDFSRNQNTKLSLWSGSFRMNGKHLRILYLLKNEKETDSRWNFDMQVESAVDKYFERYFEEIDEISSFDIATTLTREPRFW